MTPPNVFEPDFDAESDRPGFIITSATRRDAVDFWEGEEPPEPEE